MDHGGQFEREGSVMSRVQVAGVDLCDNLNSPVPLTAQTPNLNQTNALIQTQSLAALQREDGGGRGLFQKASLGNNGPGVEGEQEKEQYMGSGREEGEEEDVDEVMKEEEEEEVSEGSSCLIRCQSPDTPMTDSSYSETGSLLETPYPFSPGTSPEPTSPVIPVVSPETTYPIGPGQLSQSDVKVDSLNSNSVASFTGSNTMGPACTTEPIEKQTTTSDTRSASPPGPAPTTQATDRIAKNTDYTTDHLTSSSGPGTRGLTSGFAGSYAGPAVASAAETLTVTACTTRLNSSFASTPASPTSGPLSSITGPMAAGTESTSATGPRTSHWEHVTSTPVPTCFAVSACATGPIPSPVLLQSLEQLAQKGDDTHLPQYLHQIAEAFVLQEDYQRALWCVQLERLYHQRVLDNLNALQQHWESQCRQTSSNLATQHLDTLKHICQTHNRPRARDAECAPPQQGLDVLRPSLEDAGSLPPCTRPCQVDGRMEQRAEDSALSLSGHPVKPSANLSDGLNPPETGREDPGRESEGRDGFLGSQLTEGGEEEGGVERLTPLTGKEMPPSTAGEMDQSKPAEQQGGDLGLTQEKEAKSEEEEEEEEERDVEEAVEALEMEDEGEDEEEERQRGRDSAFCRDALPVETLASGAEVEGQQLHQEAQADEEPREETQEAAETCPHQEAQLPQAQMQPQERGGEDEEEEFEYEYEVEQADIIREAASLDDMAKLITVEEISPASGLVSILKKRSVCADKSSLSASSEPRSDKPPAKRRVRFKVPDDSYEQEVGGGDSCLLLFLLCLVTVVISVGGTALYCALGDAHSTVCQDFSRNADFYIVQIQRGISHIQHWFTPAS